MKILYLTARLPYAPIKGDMLIAYNQIKRLHKKCDIYLVSLFDSSKNDTSELEKYCKKIFLFKFNHLHAIFRMIKSFFNLKPLQVNYFFNKKIKPIINEVIKEVKPDIIHVQTIRMAEYVFNIENTKKSLDLIDALALNMLNRARLENIFLKLPFLFEYSLIKRYEKRVLKHFDKKLIISENDKNFVLNYCPEAKLEVNPNGVETKNIIRNEKEESIIFQGNLEYFPNVDSAIYLAKKIFPEVKKSCPDLKLYLIGKYSSKKFKRLKDPNIILTGFLKDMDDYFRKATIAVYPLRSGSGLQNKVLEALSAGIPTIISETAKQGISGLKDNENIIIAYDEKDFITKTIELLNNKIKREKLAVQGKKIVEKNYSWDQNTNNLYKLWEEEK